MSDKPVHGLPRRRVLQAAIAPVAMYVLASAGALAQTPTQKPAQTPAKYKVTVKRDPGCGCCHVWADIMTKSGRFDLAVSEEQDMAAYKKRAGVPPALSSCHTAIVQGYFVEGHVPVADILRLLNERPKDVVGIAAPGMPRGSPGMEMPDGSRDAYNVIALHRDGRQSVFSAYAAKG